MPHSIFSEYLKSMHRRQKLCTWLGDAPLTFGPLGVRPSPGTCLPARAADVLTWSQIPDVVERSGPFLFFQYDPEKRDMTMHMANPTAEQVTEFLRLYYSPSSPCDKLRDSELAKEGSVFIKSFNVPSEQETPGSCEIQENTCRLCNVRSVSVKSTETLRINNSVVWQPLCQSCRWVQEISLTVPEKLRTRATLCLWEHLEEALSVYSAYGYNDTKEGVPTTILCLRRNTPYLHGGVFNNGTLFEIDSKSNPYFCIPHNATDEEASVAVGLFKVHDNSYPDITYCSEPQSHKGRLLYDKFIRSPGMGLYRYEDNSVARISDHGIIEEILLLQKTRFRIAFEPECMWGEDGRVVPVNTEDKPLPESPVGCQVITIDSREHDIYGIVTQACSRKTLLQFRFRFTHCHDLNAEQVRNILRILGSVSSQSVTIDDVCFAGRFVPSKEGDFTFVYCCLALYRDNPSMFGCRSVPTCRVFSWASEWRVIDVFRNPLKQLKGLSRPPWVPHSRDSPVCVTCLEPRILDSKLSEHVFSNPFCMRTPTIFDHALSEYVSDWSRAIDTEHKWPPSITHRDIMIGAGKRRFAFRVNVPTNVVACVVLVYIRDTNMIKIERKPGTNAMDKLRMAQEHISQTSDSHGFFFECGEAHAAFLSPAEQRAMLSMVKYMKQGKKNDAEIGVLVHAETSLVHEALFSDADTTLPYYKWGDCFGEKVTDYASLPSTTRLAIYLSRYIECVDIEYSSGNHKPKNNLQCSLCRLFPEPTLREKIKALPLPFTFYSRGVRIACLRVINPYFIAVSRTLSSHEFPIETGIENTSRSWYNKLNAIDGTRILDTHGYKKEAVRGILRACMEVLDHITKSQKARKSSLGFAVPSKRKKRRK